MMPTSWFCSSFRTSVALTPSTSRISWLTSFFTVYVLYTRLRINVRGWRLCLVHGTMQSLSVFNIKAALWHALAYLCLHLDIRTCLRMRWFSDTRRMNSTPALTVLSFKASAISASTHLWVNSFTASRSSVRSLKYFSASSLIHQCLQHTFRLSMHFLLILLTLLPTPVQLLLRNLVD